MKKITFILLFFLISTNSFSHMGHYKNFNNIEMEILRNGEVIGYNFYFFKRDGNNTTVTNQIKFTVKLFGATVFEVEGYGEEKYNNCLLYTSPSPRDGLLSRMPSSA